MADKFQNKYRIQSARLQHWDYGWAGALFVTICTKDRKFFFGEIINGSMHLSGTGIIANLLWYEIKNHASNVQLGEFVVMPDHIHGIVILTGGCRDKACLVSTTPGQQRFQNQGKNILSSIIGGYKSAVTKHAHRLGFNFQWQPRFYDHIIRDDQSFQNISAYILNNPSKWPGQSKWKI